MLGGKISNQDEDEVEDELEALEREVAGVKVEDTQPVLPEVPTNKLPSKERAKARQKEQEEERTAMLA
jgi:charged multivesicular body protein 6